MSEVAVEVVKTNSISVVFDDERGSLSKAAARLVTPKCVNRWAFTIISCSLYFGLGGAYYVNVEGMK